MDENYQQKQTRDTPRIDFNKKTGEFLIEGLSLPENAFEFYNPLSLWLENYAKSPAALTHLTIYMEYINSGSLKQIFRIVYALEDMVELGSDAKVTWVYKANDELMHEKGLEFQQFLELPIELKAV